MSDAKTIQAEFVETIRPFFTPHRIDSIPSGHFEHNTLVTDVSAVVNVKGNNVGIACDVKALLKTIDGTVVEERIVIEGQFEERDCRSVARSRAGDSSGVFGSGCPAAGH